MRCKHIQIQLASDEPLQQAELDHLKLCPECSRFQSLNAGLTRETSEWRSEEPNLFLGDRIRDAVAKPQPSAKPRSRFTILAGFGATAVFAAMLVSSSGMFGHRSANSTTSSIGDIALVFTGGGAAEADLKAMVNKIQHADHVHVVVWTAPYMGQLQRSWEEWWKPGALRRTADPSLGGDRLFLGEGNQIRYHTYSQYEHRVIDAAETASQPSFTDLKHQSVQSLIKSYNHDVEGLTVGPEQVEGDHIVITGMSDNNYHRFLFVLDKTTRTPISLDMQHDVLGTWMSYMKLDFNFSTPIPESKFDVNDLSPKP